MNDKRLCNILTIPYKQYRTLYYILDTTKRIKTKDMQEGRCYWLFYNEGEHPAFNPNALHCFISYDDKTKEYLFSKRTVGGKDIPSTVYALWTLEGHYRIYAAVPVFS